METVPFLPAIAELHPSRLARRPFLHTTAFFRRRIVHTPRLVMDLSSRMIAALTCAMYMIGVSSACAQDVSNQKLGFDTATPVFEESRRCWRTVCGIEVVTRAKPYRPCCVQGERDGLVGLAAQGLRS
jgi:hypothetical protein